MAALKYTQPLALECVAAAITTSYYTYPTFDTPFKDDELFFSSPFVCAWIEATSSAFTSIEASHENPPYRLILTIQVMFRTLIAATNRCTANHRLGAYGVLTCISKDTCTHAHLPKTRALTRRHAPALQRECKSCFECKATQGYCCRLTESMT